MSRPMNLAAFAKVIKVDEDKLYSLSYEACCAVIAKHGYVLTGTGIVPGPDLKN